MSKSKKRRKADEPDRETVRQLREAVRLGILRRFVKDGVEYWVKSDQRQN